MQVAGTRCMLIAFLFPFIGPSVGDDKTCTNTPRNAEYRLKKDLFSKYDTSARPVKELINQTTVNMYFKIHFATAEEYMENEVNVHLTSWITYDANDFLRWDPKAYDGINEIRLSENFIWFPEWTTENSRSKGEQNTSNGIMVLLQSFGQVQKYSNQVVRFQCILDVSRYPYNSQACTTQLSALSYNGKIVYIPMLSTRTALSEISSWKIVNQYVERDCQSDWCHIKIGFNMEKRSKLVASAATMPITVAIILVLLSFWINPLETFRLVLLLISFLIHINDLRYFGQKLPSNGGRGILIVSFTRNSFTMCGFAMVLLIINRTMIFARHTPVWLMNAYKWVKNKDGSSLLLLSEEENILGEEEEEEEIEVGTQSVNVYVNVNLKTKSEWKLASTFFDRICFFVFILFYFISTINLFSHLHA